MSVPVERIVGGSLAAAREPGDGASLTALARRWAERCRPLLPGTVPDRPGTAPDDAPPITAVVADGALLRFALDWRRIATGVVAQVLREGDAYGADRTVGAGARVVVDFSSPNIAKPFHAGHLRSTIIGNVLCNMLAALGYRPHGINYLGDWGKQYALLCVGFARYGDADALARGAVRHLFDVYVRVNRDAATEHDGTVDRLARQQLALLEAGDAAALHQWRHFRALSVAEYERMYARLRVRFDEYSGESCYPRRSVAETLAVLRGAGVVADDPSGATLLRHAGTEPAAAPVLCRDDGSPTYLARDICAAADRYARLQPKLMLYVVGRTQQRHLADVFDALRRGGLRHVADTCEHVSFGMVRGMRSRSGDVVLLDDILDQAKQYMRKWLEERREQKSVHLLAADPDAISETAALSGIVVQDLRSRRDVDYSFDWQRMLRPDGDTGPYLQYAHARSCRSVPAPRPPFTARDDAA